MECPRGVLGEVEVSDWASKVDWLTLWAKEALATKVFNRESQMVKDLLLERLATKVETILRQETIDSLLGELGLLGLVQQSEQSQHQIGGDWEVAGQVRKLGRQKVGSTLHVNVLKNDVTE